MMSTFYKKFLEIQSMELHIQELEPDAQEHLKTIGLDHVEIQEEQELGAQKQFYWSGHAIEKL